MYTERNGVIDRVLSACRNVYVRNKAKFPNSVRGLRHSAHQIDNFNAHVLHEITINLRQFQLGKLQVSESHIVNDM